MNRHPLLPAAIAIGVLSWSSAAVLIKLCDDAPAVVIAAARLAIATMALLPVAIVARRRGHFEIPIRYVWPILASGVFLAAHFLLWITSLKHTSVLSSVVIVTTNPIFVGMASYFVFKEKVNRYLVGAIVLACIGGGVIVLADAGAEGGSPRGTILALGGAVMASCYFLVGRRLRGDVPILSYIVPVYAVAAVVLVFAALLGGHGIAGYRPTTYVYFVLLAVIPQILGHSLLNWSLRYMTATAIAVFILGEPIGSSILAFFVLHETPTLLQMGGGALTLVGIFLATRRSQ